MAQDATRLSEHGSAWHLLLELLAFGGAHAEENALEQIADAMRELGLLPAQIGRVARSVVEALRKATREDAPDQHSPAVCIRVWTSGLPTQQVELGSAFQGGSLQRDSGWGFFLLQKQDGASQAEEAGCHGVIELYLYQEAARAG